MSQPSFKTTSDEADIITLIVERAEKAYPTRFDFLTTAMDLTATHANGNPLRLADLLAADDFNFFHDLFGITACIDRRTGKLKNLFRPRFSA